jgi:hypothetical protein
MSEVRIETICPSCKEHILVSSNIPDTPTIGRREIPELRSMIKPKYEIFTYELSSEAIKSWIIQKARAYVPDVTVEVAPRYIEKKRKKYDRHRSYASFRIAFSEHIIEKNDTNGWYGKIGIDNSSVVITKSILCNLIRQYSFNIKDIDNWLSSYKALEEVEETFGMTEAYLRDLKEYAIPRRIVTNNNESWVIFSASAESIIADMMTDIHTNEIPGEIKIDDVIPISKDVVNYIIHLLPKKMDSKENPDVRKIIMGEEKK